MTALFLRELKIALAHPTSLLFMGAFMLFCGGLFPFAIGPESETLSRYGPGIIWVLVLFALSLNLNTFYAQDEQDGCLEHLLLTSHSALPLFFSKAVCQSLLGGSVTIVSVFLLSIWFGIEASLRFPLYCTIFMAIPGFVFMGGLCATLTLASKASHILHGLIFFPLCVPLLIFGMSALDSLLLNQSPLPHLKIIMGISLLMVLGSTYIGSKVLENLESF